MGEEDVVDGEALAGHGLGEVREGVAGRGGGTRRRRGSRGWGRGEGQGARSWRHGAAGRPGGNTTVVTGIACVINEALCATHELEGMLKRAPQCGDHTERIAHEHKDAREDRCATVAPLP